MARRVIRARNADGYSTVYSIDDTIKCKRRKADGVFGRDSESQPRGIFGWLRDSKNVWEVLKRGEQGTK